MGRGKLQANPIPKVNLRPLWNQYTKAASCVLDRPPSSPPKLTGTALISGTPSRKSGVDLTTPLPPSGLRHTMVRYDCAVDRDDLAMGFTDRSILQMYFDIRFISNFKMSRSSWIKIQLLSKLVFRIAIPHSLINSHLCLAAMKTHYNVQNSGALVGFV